MIAVFTAHSSSLAQEGKRPLEAPDTLAGQWEAPDGHGGTVGMNIIITTHMDGVPSGRAERLRYQDEFLVGLYRRNRPDATPPGFYFFSSAPGGGMTWDGRKLTIHALQNEGVPEVNVDLTWHEDSQSWTGLFERGSFSKQVSLKRPSSAAAQKSPFVGTWFDKREIMNNCVHIIQEPDGAFTAWSDDIYIPGLLRYANGIKPPTQTMERFGEVAKVNVDDPDQITVEMLTLTPMCCPHPFTAKLSGDRQSLTGNWSGGSNQTSRPVVWAKMPGNSCICPPGSATH